MKNAFNKINSGSAILSYPSLDDKPENSPTTKRKLQIGRTRSNNSSSTIDQATNLMQTKSSILPEPISIDTKQKSRNKKRFSVIADSLPSITTRVGSKIKEKENEKEVKEQEVKVETTEKKVKEEEVKPQNVQVTSQASKRRAEEMVRDLRVFMLQSWTILLLREKKGKQLLLVTKNFRLSKTLREIEYSDSTDSDHIAIERIPITSILSIQTEWKDPPKSKKDRKTVHIDNPPPFSFTLFLCDDDGAATPSQPQSQQSQPQLPTQPQPSQLPPPPNTGSKSLGGSSEVVASKAMHLAAENHEDYIVWLDALRGLILGPNYMELPETVQEIHSLLEVEKELQQIAFEQRQYCPPVPEPPTDFEFVT
eukprot:TRINITY_DN5720_c0_g1_i1.p1 TRINITY_DN5720_c0_g1~~TRINITY_DN5720_c0_g1_i1.p1  ORF type:complete len:366 (-),score=99.28 TRINITY_DN5720_c0_g1_i1:44-1141(-)